MSEKKRRSSGNTPPTQFRLETETISLLDKIAEEYGLVTRAAAVRFLARQEGKKLEKKSRDNA